MVKVWYNTEETPEDVQEKGVYMIEHINTDVKYIGSTTLSFHQRWNSHIYGLMKNVGNAVLVNISKKYGIDGFRFRIIEILSNATEEEIRNRERHWIECFDTYKHGANCTLETMCAFKKFDRNRIITEKERYKRVLAAKYRKEVYLYDKQGNLILTFPSAGYCDKFFNIKHGSTSRAITHPLRSITKEHYYPSYEEKMWYPESLRKEILKKKAQEVANIRKKRGNYKISDKQRLLIRNSNPKNISVNLYTLNGEFVKTFISQNACDDYLNLTRGTTSKVLKGKAKTLKRKYIPKIA